MIQGMNVEQEQAGLLTTAKHAAELILQKGQEVRPLLLTLHGEELKNITLVAMPIPMSNRAESRAFLIGAAQAFPLFVTVQEIWKSHCTKEEAEDPNRPPPSQDPKRTEAVAVCLIYQGKTIHQDMLVFVRKDGKVTFGKWESDKDDGVASWTIPKDSIFPPKEEIA
jgi:hypothetical protein